jgi:hypothetical protein
MGYLITLLVVAGVALAAFLLARRYLAIRGARLVACPEDQTTAAVRVASARAALGGNWRLSDCSRWPEQHACGRECLQQIERAPEACLVRNILSHWYEDKNCIVCGKTLGGVDWFDRKPAVADADGRTHLWHDMQPESIPEILATHRPVCFDCYVAETFRREHPELILDNPWTRAEPPR